MPSGRSQSRLDLTDPVFFLDRGLGVNFDAERLRGRGHRVLPMVDVYPGGADQGVSDDDWISRASDENWIALTKDYAIIRDHSVALAASTLRVFALSNAHLTGAQMADRYDANLNRILLRSRKPGPYVYVVNATGLVLRWPIG